MNLTPLLYDLFARRHRLPALRSEPRFDLARERLRLPLGPQLEQLAEASGPLLEPRRLAESLPRGRAGVAVLDRPELDAFLGDLPAADPGEADRWWDFLALDDGSYLLVPDDTSPAAELQVLLPVRVGADTYQLRRLTTEILTDPTGALRPGDTSVDVDLCHVNGTRDLDELPYVGTCEGEECAAGCADVVAARAQDGGYRLTGCTCPPDEDD